MKLPRGVRSEMACLRAEEVERLAVAVPHRYQPLVHVLAYGGLRWGEATALRRHRCDLDAGRLIVAESLADVNGRAVFGQTKTYRVRKTRIPEFLVEELRAHLETVHPASDALLFTAPRGGPLRIANFRRRVWWPALETAGLPRAIRIHDLRHTCASLLIRQGVHPKAIQHHLGHSSINITMDRYGHLLPDQYDDLASRLDLVHSNAVPRNSRGFRVGTSLARRGVVLGPRGSPPSRHLAGETFVEPTITRASPCRQATRVPCGDMSQIPLRHHVSMAASRPSTTCGEVAGVGWSSG